jgi:two-component system cell cycle response regulator
MQRLVPLAPRPVIVVLGLLVAGFAVYLAGLTAGMGTDSAALSLWLPFGLIAGSAVLSTWRAVTVAEARSAWILIALGCLAWTAADLIYNVALAELSEPPVPSVADVLYLAFYPLAIGGLALRLRHTDGRLPGVFWIDGAVGLCATVATATFIAGFVQISDFSAETLVNAAYPVADVVLLTLLGAAFALGRVPFTPGSLLLAAAVLGWVVSDTAYLQLMNAGSYVEGTLWDAGWPLAAVVISLAAWHGGGSERREAARWRPLIIPAVFGMNALALLVVEHFGSVSSLSVLLAALAMVLIVVRLALTFGENLRLLDEKHAEANTDALTGLANRRALLEDLAHAVAAIAQPTALVLYDLNGFKRYNDAFGHPVGDELLRRLGRQLRRQAEAIGARAYRLGGDEFCLLAPLDGGGPGAVGDRGALALCEQGEGFEISASWGAVALQGREDSSDALREADRLMYEHKRGGRASAAEQTLEALLAAARERRPDLGDHLDGVIDTAAELAERLGLNDGEVLRVRQAAGLHDIGKIAIPDAVLDKPDALDAAEWAFMKRHTLIGERILQAAEDLQEAAPLVRSSHEHWDGTGYPDGLAGEDIPLGARIIAVSGAFDAMLSRRAYRRPLDVPEALAEVRRCAGTQFDPAVVQAFVDVMERRRNLLRAGA